MAAYSDAEFDSFAQVVFRKHVSNNNFRDVWGDAMQLAAPICARSDVRTLIGGLNNGDEFSMYPKLLALSKIVMLDAARREANNSTWKSPPDPFVKFTTVNGERTWVETAAALKYRPLQPSPFILVDTHDSPIGGLHVEEQ